MPVEIIISVRDEVPANLERTVRQARQAGPVCVVFDGCLPDPYDLPGDVRRETITQPRGCGQARHIGIVTSKADAVVLIDGHMQFPGGWMETILAHLEKHPKDVTCCRMRSLRHDWKPHDAAVYAGAHIETHCLDAGTFAIAAKWNSATEGPVKSGPVGSPMGACYGMTRDWYLAMGEPLRLLEAWGGDEELLAICGWFCGGRTWLLPTICGHIYAAPRRLPRVGCATSDAEILVNRRALADIIPGDTSGLSDWHKKRRIPSAAEFDAYERRRGRIEALRAHLAEQKRTWIDFIHAGWARRYEPTDQDRKRFCMAPAASRRVVKEPSVSSNSGRPNKGSLQHWREERMARA